MKKYNDEERIEIAKREYYNYEKGNPLLIGKGNLPIGYVADFKDKATGEQTYVVTDKRLGENPSIMELASVKKSNVIV